MEIYLNSIIINNYLEGEAWLSLSIKERRSHPRILIDEKVNFSTDYPTNEGFTYNLSPNGVSLISDTALPVGSNIKINIYFKRYDTNNAESEEVVTVEGKVVWVSGHSDLPAKMGIKFNKPNPELLRFYMKNEAELQSCIIKTKTISNLKSTNILK